VRDAGPRSGRWRPRCGVTQRRVPVCGVTGTNGKTTTTHLIAAVLDHAASPRGPGTLSGRFTTPEAPDLQEQLARFVAEGRRAVVMEVSSHALALHRTDGTHFAVAAFTNLAGPPRLPRHDGAVLRSQGAPVHAGTVERAVIWVDDPRGRLLADAVEMPVAEVRAADAAGLVLDAAGARFTCGASRSRCRSPGATTWPTRSWPQPAPRRSGWPTTPWQPGCRRPRPCRAAWSPSTRAGLPVLVDFAHTPEGLGAVLANLRRSRRAG